MSRISPHFRLTGTCRDVLRLIAEGRPLGDYVPRYRPGARRGRGAFLLAERVLYDPGRARRTGDLEAKAMGKNVKHSVDGRFEIDLDADDIEIVGMMLADKSEMDVVRELKVAGRSLGEIVALIREAKGAQASR